MTNLNATSLRKNLFEVLENTIQFNEPVNVSTKNGNAVILSEEDYNGLMETVYLSTISGLEQKLKDGLNSSLADCIPENEVVW